MSKPARWNDEEVEHLRAHYPSISAARLTELLQGRTAKAIERQAERMGLGKCHERLREMGRTNILHRWHPEVFKTPEAPPQ